MTGDTPQDVTAEVAGDKLPWSAPQLELVGTMRDVAGGGNPGLDSNSLPAALS